MGWEFSDVVRFDFDLGPLLQGQTRIAELKSAYNSRHVGIQSAQSSLKICYPVRTGIQLKRVYNLFIIDPRGLQCETNLHDIVGWESSDVRFDLWPLLQGQTMVHWLW